MTEKEKKHGKHYSYIRAEKNNKRPGSYHPAALGNYQETKSNNS